MLRRLTPAFALLVLSGACSDSASSYDGPPVLVIGVDGLEWSVLEPLMEAGRAPHLKALAERGVGGSLQTQIPTFSPVVWTTIATGMNWQDHGIRHFLQPVRGADGRPAYGKPYTSNTRAVPAIWNMAGDGGRDVLSVAWWVSWPAEQVPGARIVASYAAQVQANILWKAGVWVEGLPELTWPESLQDDLLPLLQEGAPNGPLRAEYESVFGTIPEHADWEFPRKRDQLFRVTYHGDRTHQRMMKQLLREEVADLNLVYFGLADVAGHFFWRYHEREAFQYPIPQDHVARLRDRINQAYQVVDGWIGEILAEVPEDTIVLVVSDHGMHAFNVADPDNVQSGAHEDAPDGVFILAGPGVEPRGLLPAKDRRIAGVLQVAPTVLDWLGLCVARDMPGRPLRHLMTPEWRAEHPGCEVPSYREGFRAPTPPREPGEGVNRHFVDGLQELGYVE